MGNKNENIAYRKKNQIKHEKDSTKRKKTFQ
jgi:hypothetical protein